MKSNPRLFTLSLMAVLISLPAFGQNNPVPPATTTAPPLPALSAPADTLTPQIEKGIVVAESKLETINKSISKQPAQPAPVQPEPGDTTKPVQTAVTINTNKLISETDSLLYELRLRVELLDPKIIKSQNLKKKIKFLQESSKQLLVKTSAAHLPLAEKLDLADKNLKEATGLLDKTNTSASRPETEPAQPEASDSVLAQNQSGSSIDIKANLLSARKLVIEADSTLTLVSSLVPSLDSKQRETTYLSERLHALKIMTRDLKNLTASAGMSSTVATRRLIDPAADWDFDAKTPLTTDPRVNPVKAYLDKNLGENGNIFKTIQKDSMIFTFRVPDAWRKNEKFKFPVISYQSPDKKIIITMNQSTASVDSLHYWAAIYEASSYGKNQLSGSYTRFPKSRAQSFGADQSYVAKYHFGSREIAALFLQRKSEVVAAFVEYPNGSLNDSDAAIINLFLNSLKYKEIK